MHRIRKPAATRAAAAAVGMALVLSACGGGGGDDSAAPQEVDDPAECDEVIGITEDSITIGSHMPLTGVAAPGYSTIPLGTQAYFDYVNANGGVNGRQIEFLVRDSAYNPTQASQVVNELVLQDEIFMLIQGLGTPVHGAVMPFLNDEGVPDLFVSSGALKWNQPEEFPYTFGWQPNYEVEGKIIGRYIAENFPDARVGLFLQGDDFGEDGSRGARQFIDDQIVAEVSYVPGNTDVGPQIAELQAAGADFVVGFNVPSYTALSQLAALRLNYDPEWFYSNVGSDATLVGGLLERFSEGAVAGAGPLEGVYTTRYLPTVDAADNEWITLFNDIWAEHGDDQPLNNFMVYGMSGAYSTIQALQAAGDCPTRDGIVDAVERQGAEFEGPWLAPMDYSEESHRGISGVAVAQISNGAYETLTPVFITDGGEDATIEEFSDEPFTPDEDGIPNVEPVG